MRAVIILFAKAPRPGSVKTRLTPPLTAFEATELHEAFVDDMIERLQTLPTFDLELHTDVNTDAWSARSVTRKLQTAGSLGLKMVHALHSALASGYHRAAIVGSDAPTLPLPHIEYLLNSPAQVTLGPADDGGFWGIAAGKTHPAMFREVMWSRSDTFEQTLRALHATGLEIAVGPAWFDVDEPTDLERLLASPDLPPATRRWAARYRANAVRTAKS